MTLADTGVCVVIAAFNAQLSIGRAVRSALMQDHVREVLVVDDASGDATADAARQHDDGSGRLSVIALARNVGPARARNIALERSRQPYFCVLDSDDYFLPGRLAKLFANPAESWDLIADDIVIVPEEFAARPVTIIQKNPPGGVLTLDLATFVLSNVSDPTRPRGEMGFLKPVIRRQFLQQHGIQYEDKLRLGEDYALYARALMAGARFRVVSASGYIAIERQESISGRHTTADLANLAAFDAECLETAPNLIANDRAALARHLTATRHKLHHRQLLDCKKDRGLLAALGILWRMPGSLPHIAAETIRARAGGWFPTRGNNLARNDARRTRLLVGVPGVRLLDDSPAHKVTA